jgi:hypothetical protein
VVVDLAVSRLNSTEAIEEFVGINGSYALLNIPFHVASSVGSVGIDTSPKNMAIAALATKFGYIRGDDGVSLGL